MTTDARGARWRVWASAAIAGPLAGAVVFLAVATLFPIRLDDRNFHELRRIEGLSVTRGVPTLFASLDTGSESLHFAEYVVPQLAFPAQTRLWIAPRGAVEDGSLGAVGVDSEGETWMPGPDSRLRREGRAAELLRPFLHGGVVLYDSEDVKAILQARIPILRTADESAVIHAPSTQSIVPRRPRNEFTATRVIRITALLGLPFCLAALFRRPLGSRLFAAAVAVWASPIAWIWLMSWSQLVPATSPGAWIFLAWGASALALWRAAGRESPGQGSEEPPPWRSTLGRFAPMAFAAVYVSTFLLRLDFDEDTQTHWMLMARSYFFHGRHLPRLLSGHVRAATYPFGYAEFLSIAGWLAGVPRASFLGLGGESGVALLGYRMAIAALELAMLGLVGCFLAGKTGGRRGLAVAGVALTVALFSLTQGHQIGAETLLFPILAGSIVVIGAARRRGSRGLMAIALFVAAAASLVKLEAALLLVAVVLPWVLGGEAQPAARWRLASAVLLMGVAALPTLIWKLTLPIPDTIYTAPAVNLSVIGSVYSRAATVLLKNDRFLLFFGALPLAALFNWRRRRRWSDFVVPISIWGACAGLAAIYVFTTLPRMWQIDVSYPRLVMLPAFSALLYCLAVFLPEEPSLEASSR